MKITIVHQHILIGAKFCVKYETPYIYYKDLKVKYGTAPNEWIKNVADVEVTFVNNDVETFELDDPKYLGGTGHMCKYLTANLEVSGVRIRQNEYDVSWPIQSLKLPMYVGSIFDYAFSMNGKNELFWVDKNGDCTKNRGEKECCKDGKWCNLMIVEPGGL